MRHTIGDKIISVCQKSINFLTNLCSQMDPDLSDFNKRELNSHAEFIIPNLIEKLGDNLAKVRQASEEAILVMCNHPAFGPKLCVNHIVRKATTGPKPTGAAAAKKTMNSNKLIIGKYLILARVFSEVQGLTQDVHRSALPFVV